MSGLDSGVTHTEPDKAVCEQKAIEACSKMLAEDERLYGKKQIDNLHVRPNDLGAAVGVYVVGPDAAKLLGEEKVRQIGQGTILFAGAPLYGIGDQLKNGITHPVESAKDTITNALGGAAVGLVETVAPPIGLGVLAVGSALGLANGSNELFGNEHKERNTRFSKAISSIGHLDSVGLVASTDVMRNEITPPVANAAVDLATTAYAFKAGNALSRDAALHLPKVDISAPIETANKVLKDVQTEIQKFVGGRQLNFAVANSGENFAPGPYAPFHKQFEELVSYCKAGDNGSERRNPGSDADAHGWKERKNGELYRPMTQEDRDAIHTQPPSDSGWSIVEGSPMTLWQRHDKRTGITEYSCPSRFFSLCDNRTHLFYNAAKDEVTSRPWSFPSEMEHLKKADVLTKESDRFVRSSHDWNGPHTKH